MFVVIEIDGWDEQAEDLLRELRMLQDVHDAVVACDPEDRDGGLALATEDISVDVTRIVGMAYKTDISLPAGTTCMVVENLA